MLNYQEANLEYWSCLWKQSWYKVAIMVMVVWPKLKLMSLGSSNKWVNIWPCDLVHHKLDSSQDSVRIEPLKVWRDVIDLEFVIYLMIFQFHFYLSLFHVLYFMSIFVYHLLHCNWFRCIRSCTKNPSHVFLTNRWLVHNWFVSLGNLLEVVVCHLLIGGMVGLS